MAIAKKKSGRAKSTPKKKSGGSTAAKKNRSATSEKDRKNRSATSEKDKKNRSATSEKNKKNRSATSEKNRTGRAAASAKKTTRASMAGTGRQSPGRLAVYPGSFDPITRGHVDIIRRACHVFSEVTVAVAYNPNKDAAMFSPEERIEMIYESLPDLRGRVVADSFTGLLVDYARKIGAGVLVRGLRAVSDFEYEFQMTMMNRHLSPDVETVFLMAGEQHFYTSSRLVKEVARFGGDVSNFVPEEVLGRFRERLADVRQRS